MSWVVFVYHRLQSAVKLVFFTSSGHSFIMLKVSPVGDSAMLVDAIFLISLRRCLCCILTFISVHSCSLFGMAYQLLSRAANGILSDIFATVDSK